MRKNGPTFAVSKPTATSSREYVVIRHATPPRDRPPRRPPPAANAPVSGALSLVPCADDAKRSRFREESPDGVHGGVPPPPEGVREVGHERPRLAVRPFGG
mmetsp:Transcript_638/g.1568  ORF Transcript_638/g.1568 Transcript_638/m.1568 type:complete len:101 (+) Transcript_638:345-647(+)